MIDIHTHILPMVDDGAYNIDEAVSMARVAVDDGITHMFATPHHISFGSLRRPELVERVARLQAKLDAANIALTILPGYEVRLQASLLDDWANNIAGPLGTSRYVLAEPPFHHYGPDTETLLFELFERGYVPIMAHPERIRPIQDNLSLLDSFLERGGITQITSHSLTGYHGHRAKAVAKTMLEHNLVHIIASDTHNSGRRPPVLSNGVEIAAEIVGEAKALAMVTTAPLAVINDQPITAPMMTI